MDSLLRAGEAIKGFILPRIDEEEIELHIKIVAAILVTAYYNQYLSAACHQITSAIEFKTNSFFKLELRTGSGTYLCLIINKLLRDERKSLKPKT